MEARVYDLYENPLFEGKALYNRAENAVHVRTSQPWELKRGSYIVRYSDNQGFFDFRCDYIRYEFDASQHIYVMEVKKTLSVIQRRQDVKMKTNLPIRVTLLDQNNAVVIDPATQKALQFPATLRDISAGGIMVDTDYRLGVDQNFMFPFNKGSTPIVVTAQVIREQAQGEDFCRYGCKFINHNRGKEAVLREYVFRLETATRRFQD